MALVGTEAILVSDVLSALEERLEANLQRLAAQRAKAASEAGPNAPDRQPSEAQLREELRWQRHQLVEELLAAVAEASVGLRQREHMSEAQWQRRGMLEQLLKPLVETKLIYADARRKIPSENMPNVEKQLTKRFEEHELRKLMKQAGVESRRDLEQYLRARGSSIDRERRNYIERNVAQEWLRHQTRLDEEITYNQMLHYYRTHAAEFDRPARTRWQMFSVLFSRYPSKDEAYAAIVALGNRLIAGEDFAEVARAAGDPSAGQVREWPDKSRFITPVVEKAIEGLPPGTLSPILEDWRGYHIVKVVERLPAGRLPFEMCQSEIREKLRHQRAEEQVQRYLARLRSQIPIWTILDDAEGKPTLMGRSPKGPSHY